MAGQIKSPRSVPQYGGRPLSYSVAPLLIKKSEAQFIETALTDLLKKVEAFTEVALRDKQILKDLGVPEDLDPRPTPLGLHIPFARFDFLFDGKNLNVMELNTDGTAGFNVNEWIAEEAGLKPSENPNFKISERLLQALLEHSPEAREVVLMDFPEVGTSWEQHDLIKRWKPLIRASLGNPAVRQWKKDALIYRRVLSWQLRAHPERCQPFLQDWKDGQIKVVGGWSSDVGMSKAWPAFVKPQYVPETLLIEDGVVEKIKSEKDTWVIKGALSFSGHSVFRGLDLQQERWMACVDQALKESQNGRPWVAQRRVEVPKVDGKPIELGLYFLNGKPSGYMARWGSDQVISETSEEVLRPVRMTP